MTPYQAKKVALAITILNCILSLSTITWCVKIAVDMFYPPEKQDFIIQLPPAPAREQNNTNLDKFSVCWDARVLADKPVEIKKVVEAEKPKLPVVQEKMELPFEWVAAAVHSIPEKTYAILLDKRNQQQILVKVWTVIPNSAYRVTQITNNAVEIQNGNSKGVLAKPKMWQPEMSEETAKNVVISPEKTLENKPKDKVFDADCITVENNKLLVLDSRFAEYGLQKKDHILVADGKRVANISQFQQVMADVQKKTENTMDISVLRQGSIISLKIPIRK